jgi:hypothetical protein
MLIWVTSKNNPCQSSYTVPCSSHTAGRISATPVSWCCPPKSVISSKVCHIFKYFSPQLDFHLVNMKILERMTTLDCVLLKKKICSLYSDWGRKSVFEPVFEYYLDCTTLPNAGYTPSIFSFFLCSAQKPQRRLRLYELLNSTVSC